MKYIIMCGGKYDYWTFPKQLTRVLDETIVERTIRLLRDNGVNDIAISTQDKRFSGFGVPLLSHENDFAVAGGECSGSWASGFYPLQEPACYIFGDVVFSNEAIKTIVNTETDDIAFFASAPPFSEKYLKKHAEPFSFKVVNQRRFRAAVNFVIESTNTGIFDRPPIAWELWQVLNGESVRDINFYNYVVINDYTCDIDRPYEVKNIERAIYDENTNTRLQR